MTEKQYIDSLKSSHQNTKQSKWVVLIILAIHFVIFMWFNFQSISTLLKLLGPLAGGYCILYFAVRIPISMLVFDIDTEYKNYTEVYYSVHRSKEIGGEDNWKKYKPGLAKIKDYYINYIVSSLLLIHLVLVVTGFQDVLL